MEKKVGLCAHVIGLDKIGNSKQKIRSIVPSILLTAEFLFLIVTSHWSKMQFTCFVCI